MKLTTMSKVNSLIEDMLTNGWTLVRAKKHLILSVPGARGTITVPRTCPDYGRTSRNVLATIRRQRAMYEGGNHAG